MYANSLSDSFVCTQSNGSRQSEVLKFDMTSRLIRSGLFDHLSIPVKAKVECCKSLDHSIARSQTAQPAESCPQALWYADHS